MANILSEWSITTPVVYAGHIKAMPGDSAVHIGDSSFTLCTSGQLAGDLYFTPANIGALGFGDYFPPSCRFSYVIGSHNQFSNNSMLQSIIIGNYLTNTISHSIMIGNNSPAIFIDPNNRVGINTSSTPDATLNINTTSSGNQFSVSSGGTDNFTIDNAGNTFITGQVKINTNTPSLYQLDVNGVIRSNEVKVCAFGGCDFVFDKNYKLMPLDTLYAYINKNHHLPEIASAQQMQQDGNVSLGKMDSQLLQKVEELTLYILQQEQKINEQQQQLKDMQVKLDALTKQGK